MLRTGMTIVGLVAIAAAIGWFAWQRSNAPVAGQPRPNAPQQIVAAPVVQPARGQFYTVPSDTSWAWAQADGLVAAPKKPEAPRETMPAVRITRLTVHPPVNVDFSDMDLDYPGPSESASAPEARDAQRQARTHQQLNPNIDELQHHSDDDDLFNQNTGLRGFMTQSWINDNVGVQGGLAIPKERLRNDNESLGDQMAVGMGVLFAF